ERTYIRTLLAFAHLTVPSSGQRCFSIGRGAIQSLYFPLPYSYLMHWRIVYNISPPSIPSLSLFIHTQVIIAFFSVFLTRLFFSGGRSDQHRSLADHVDHDQAHILHPPCFHDLSSLTMYSRYQCNRWIFICFQK